MPPETARYLQRRFPRDMRTLCEILDTLDDAAFAAQRRLTVPFIRDVIEVARLADRRLTPTGAPRVPRPAWPRLRRRVCPAPGPASISSSDNVPGLRREAGDMGGAVGRAAGARLVQAAFGEGQAHQQHAVMQQRQRHGQQRRFLSAVQRLRRGEQRRRACPTACRRATALEVPSRKYLSGAAMLPKRVGLPNNRPSQRRRSSSVA